VFKITCSQYRHIRNAHRTYVEKSLEKPSLEWPNRRSKNNIKMRADGSVSRQCCVWCASVNVDCFTSPSPSSTINRNRGLEGCSTKFVLEREALKDAKRQRRSPVTTAASATDRALCTQPTAVTQSICSASASSVDAAWRGYEIHILWLWETDGTGTRGRPKAAFGNIGVNYLVLLPES
jgi:hypothetical protein